MFRFLLLVLALTVVSAALQSREYYEEKFFNWLQTHNVKPADGSLFTHYLRNFIDNEDYINAHNAKKDATYQLGHNQFSHLTVEEWREAVKLGLSAPETVATSVHAAPADLSAVPASSTGPSRVP
jgi:hypothetical protein